MECIIDQKYGFGVIKKSINKYQAYEIMGNTVFQPISSSNKVDLPTIQLAYQKDKDVLYLPRAFGYDLMTRMNLNGKDILDTNESDPYEELTSTIVLRDTQKDIVDTTIQHLSTHPCASIIAPTGIGKSFILGDLVSKLRVKRALIVVPNITLFNQTRAFFAEFFQTKVGYIQGQTKIKKDERITIASLDTLKSRRDKISELYGYFDLIIFDEVHKLGSALNNELLYRLPCRYLVGLSATKQRADNGHFIVEKWFGEPIVNVKVNRMKMECQVHLMKFPYKTSFNPDAYSSWIDWLVEHVERNKAMLRYLKHLVTKKGRKNILILTERLSHVELFANMIREESSIDLTVGEYDGEKNQAERQLALKADIIVSTTSSFGTGVSIERLDTLLFICPRKSIQQALGRVLRKAHENGVIIVDFIDQLRRQSETRLEIMKEELIFKDTETQYKHYDWSLEKMKWITRK